MSQTLFAAVAFGSAFGGLATTGYALFNPDGTPNGSRITAGVTERGTSTGIYGATLTLPDNFAGEVRWDTGGGSPVYASEVLALGTALPVALSPADESRLAHLDADISSRNAVVPDNAGIAAIQAQTDLLTFSGPAVNAFATNSVPIPTTAVITVSQTSASTVTGNAPNLLDLAITRGGSWSMTVEARGGAYLAAIDLTGATIELLVKAHRGDADNLALLTLTSKRATAFGTITVQGDPVAGTFVVALVADALSDDLVFGPRAPSGMSYGLKLWLPSGAVIPYLAGAFRVSEFPIKATAVPA